MRILINALSARRGGGQTYLVNLLERIPSDGADVFVLAPESLKLPLDPRIKRVASGQALENPFIRAAWERTRLPAMAKSLKADVIFCPGGVVSFRAPAGVRVVTMFRNMIPFDHAQRSKYPYGYMRFRNWLLERVMTKSMLSADLVIFISEYAREVIEKRTEGGVRRSVVIPHGVNPSFMANSSNEPPRPSWAPNGSYLLYVSTIDVYKAQREVVEGFALLKRRRETKEKLLLVGHEYPPYAKLLKEDIARLGLENDVILAGPIPYRELPAAYRHAKINIFASECENCPNILLEALGAGRPVLCSSTPPMPEFGGDAPVYFSPSSPEDFAEKLGRAIDDSERLEAMGRAASARASLYDWDTTARKTWEAIFALCGEGSE